MGRIVMSCIYPAWQVIGDQFQEIVERPIYLNKLAVEVDSFWRAIPFSQIRKVARSDKGFTVTGVGPAMPCQDVEFGTIKGKGAFGDVVVGRNDVASFEIDQ